MQKRFFGIDAIRGFALVNMVLFHFLYDVFMVFGKDSNWIYRPIVFFWQQSICWTFILISGFVWSWGKRQALKRGLILNIWGGVITLVTIVFLPEETIWFGILNFMGCSILLLLLLEKPLSKIPASFGMLLFFFLFQISYRVPDGNIKIVGFSFAVPDFLYHIKILTPLGFPFPGFCSGDYFPVLPWFFLFVTGYFSEKIFRRSERLQETMCKPVPVLSLIGKHSLLVYLLHQPLCFGICLLQFGGI